MRYWNLLLGAALSLGNSPVLAAQIAPGPNNVARTRPFWDQCFGALFYSLLALGAIIVGLKLLKLTLRIDVRREVCERGNVAAAILATGVALGICLVIAAVLLS